MGANWEHSDSTRKLRKIVRMVDGYQESDFPGQHDGDISADWDQDGMEYPKTDRDCQMIARRDQRSPSLALLKESSEMCTPRAGGRQR
jgi:hypothetical protein